MEQALEIEVNVVGEASDILQILKTTVKNLSKIRDNVNFTLNMVLKEVP